MGIYVTYIWFISAKITSKSFYSIGHTQRIKPKLANFDPNTAILVRSGHITISPHALWVQTNVKKLFNSNALYVWYTTFRAANFVPYIDLAAFERGYRHASQKSYSRIVRHWTAMS